jgi:hypothetical protein
MGTEVDLKVSFSGVFWSLLCIAVGLLFLSGSWGSYAEYQRVQNYEGRSIGHVTNKHHKLGSDGGGNYYMDYWFMSSAGVKISATSIIAKQQWDMTKVDDTMEIRYDQSHPERNIPMYGGSPSLVFAFFMLILAGVFLLFGGSRFFHSFQKNKSSH